MNQINYLSDIKLLENYPKTDNFIYHFTTDGETCYNVSLEDGNCRKDGDYLVICLDNHGLPEGLLRVRREFHFPDDDFPDKDWTKIVEHSYDIYLAEGVDIEADQYVLPTYMPIFKGEKGDDGEDYVITEADYEAIADIAATKVDCYTTAEVDAKFSEVAAEILGVKDSISEVAQDKQDKLTYYTENPKYSVLEAAVNNEYTDPRTGETVSTFSGLSASETNASLSVIDLQNNSSSVNVSTYGVNVRASYITLGLDNSEKTFKILAGENDKELRFYDKTFFKDGELVHEVWENYEKKYIGYYDKNEADAKFDLKQEVLVSGANIKTINGESILGAGNLVLDTGKIDDVQVDGVSVVTDKVANIELAPINERIDELEDKVDELQLYKFPNATIFGQPTINNGQVSNFSDTNYLQMPFIVDFANRPYTIDFNFTTPSGAGYIPQLNLIDSEFGLAVAVRDNRLVVAVSSNGTSWDGEYISDVYLGSEDTYNASISGDGTNLTVTINDESKVFSGVGYPYPKQIIIGKGVATGKAFGGSINLNYAKLTISDKVVWQGMDDVGIATRAAIDLSNIDAAGEAKIKEIAGDSGVTEERVQELINAAIGDMDAILDIMLGTSDIDGQLNRIIG